MLDIVELADGGDMNVMDAVVAKAGNVLAIQIGDLEYSPEFGVDLRFFLESEFQFQNANFQSYLVQRLTENHINVAQVVNVIESLLTTSTYTVGEIKEASGGLIL